MADDKPKVRFTEFEARCKRCRFCLPVDNKHAGGVRGCAVAHRNLKQPIYMSKEECANQYLVWTHYDCDWCPKFDEVQQPKPGLLRRLAKGLGLI